MTTPTTHDEQILVTARKMADSLETGEFPEDLEPQAVAYILRTCVCMIRDLTSPVSLIADEDSGEAKERNRDY